MTRSGVRPADPRRILIVRVSAMGDLVFATPLADAIRARWPSSEIAWLVSPALAGLLESVPTVDRVVPWPPPSGFASLGSLRGLRTELRDAGIDLVIEAQGLLKTRLMAAQVDAWRVGFRSREPGERWIQEPIDKGGDVRLIGSEYRFLAESLTGQASSPPRLAPGESHRAAAAELLRGEGLAPGFLALCPFTTRPQKHWPAGHWSALIEALRSRGEAPIAVLGGPGDGAAAAAIIEAAGGQAVNLAGRTPIRLLPAVIEAAEAVIGVDTGLTHIGVATARPTVAIFGSTCPYLFGGRGPLQVVYDALPCAPCRRHPTCDGRFTCLAGIGPDRILDAVDAVRTA